MTRTRSPLTNARDVARKWDGTSISDKAVTDLRATALLKVQGPGANGVITFPTPITGIAYIAAYTTATGAPTATGGGLTAYPAVDGAVFSETPENADGVGELAEEAGTDWSTETLLIHYYPDAEDIDEPSSAKGDVFNPLPLA